MACTTLILAALTVGIAELATGTSQSSPAPLRFVRFTDVHVSRGFWHERLETNRNVTLPHCLSQCQETGRIGNFAVAAGRIKGELTGEFKGYFFNDSDVFKVLEGAAHCLATRRDAALETRVDELIDLIAAAQEPDGYLYCSRTICSPGNMPPGGRERWSNIADGHELYNVGHLYEAAVAHHAATGKRTLLDVAIRNADLVCRVFGEGRNPHPCGHPEIELALAKLHAATGDEKYLRQARWFIEARGRGERKRYGDYAQDHLPIAQQTEAVGHAVRAAYLFSGALDVAQRTDAAELGRAAERLWDDVLRHKLYLTGGIGARGAGEAFGDRYELPNVSAYAETCAAIAEALWAQRMFVQTRDGGSFDVLERALLNGVLSGVSLRGDRFFYPNPLASRSGAERPAWFACACCPSNVVRFLPQVPGWVYSHAADVLYVNLFIASDAEFEFGAARVKVKQETDYPWDGAVRLTIDPGATPRDFELRLRLPGWARGAPVPSDLYTHASAPAGLPSAELLVNGEKQPFRVERGYAHFRRTWKSGDRVEWLLPMPVQRIRAHAGVAANTGRVALERGPLVYCVEASDIQGASPFSLVLADDVALNIAPRADLLGGVSVVEGVAGTVRRRLDGGVEPGEPAKFIAIPYFTWANRARSAMNVWLARDASVAEPLPAPTLAARARVSASFGAETDSLRDQIEPRSSGDQESTRWHWWPHKGTSEWVQFDLPQPAMISGVQVYWFDDTGVGECRLPRSWKLLARVDGEWREVEGPSEYGVAADRYNRTTFAPLKTDGLRLELQSAAGFAGGIHELRIESP